MIERQKQFFADWRNKDPKIVSDGIVDDKAYLPSPLKILYLLKEVNGGESCDLCEFLASGARPQTWDNITRWTIGIHQLDCEIQGPTAVLRIDRRSQGNFKQVI